MYQETIQKQIQYWADKEPQKVAVHLCQTKQSHTYCQLNDLCQSYELWFQKNDINASDIFTIALPNSLACIEILYAAYYTGRVVMALNLTSGEHAKEFTLTHAEPKKIICDYADVEEFKQFSNVNPQQIIAVDKNKSPVHDFTEAQATNNNAVTVVEPNAPALLMYTSGTTGNPKGVVLSQKNLLSGGQNTAIAHQLTTNDIGICVLPLYHINAQCVSIQSCLVSGSTLVLTDKFSVSNFLPTLVKYKCTWASLVPTMICYLLNHLSKKENNTQLSDLKNLKFIRSASAPLPIEVHQKIQKKLKVPVIETMGITEAAAQILSNPRENNKQKIGSVGLAYGNEIRILDEHFNEAATNQEGEIAVKGNNVMQGYYKNPESTQKAFCPNGWFLTGDLGSMDVDKYVTVTGRKKELIIKGGENISPREIDEVLYLKTDILEAAAFARKNKLYGQCVEACVVLDNGSNLTEQDLLKHCEKQLGSFKAPDKIHILRELPKGPSGKIQRLKLEELLYDD